MRNFDLSSLLILAFTFISQAALKSKKGGKYLPKGMVELVYLCYEAYNLKRHSSANCTELFQILKLVYMQQNL